MFSKQNLLICLLYFITITSSIQFLSLPEAGSYNELKAKEFWYYQVMSECDILRIQSWDVPPVSVIYPNVTNIQIYHNYTETGANLAYMAFNPQTNLVFLSIRGSHNDTNRWEDADFFRTSYDQCEGCAVHEGFYHAYLDLKDQILSGFISLKKKYANAETAIFGHSLGGAIGTFAFLDLQKILKIDYFYTFGSPRIGNEEFADFSSKMLEGSNTARVTHFKDNVPHLPFSFLGFKHLDGEIFYMNEESSKYLICKRNEEDLNCSEQFNYIQTESSDHGNYMNFSMSVFTSNC